MLPYMLSSLQNLGLMSVAPVLAFVKEQFVYLILILPMNLVCTCSYKSSV